MSNISSLMLMSLAIVMSSFAIAGNGYVCVGSQSTGFIKKGAEWRQTTFQTSSYIVSKATPGDLEFLKNSGRQQAEWVVKYPGVDLPIHTCVDSQFGLNCGSGDFLLNVMGRRFVRTDTFYYVGDTKKLTVAGVAPTVSVEIGECSTF